MADEASVSKHTVAQLKALLSAHSLPVTGNKPDLVARVLANPHVLQEPASTPAVATSSAPTASVPAATTSAAAPVPAQPAVASSTSAEDELEKRKKRAERFGTQVVTAQDDAAKSKADRQQRFGTGQQEDKPDKSIAKLDAPLKSQGKGVKAETKPKAPPANVDPAKLAEEEERKRKRAERFGVPDSPDKKAKIA